MTFSPKHIFSKAKTRISTDINRVIREKAIKNAKISIALSNRNPKDLSEDELEIIVAEEEDKFKEKIKNGGLVAALIALGIN